MKRICLIVAGTLFSLYSEACSFDLEGLNAKNARRIQSALKTINPEFELNTKTGAVHFTSKEEVTQDQVQVALANANIQNVEVKQSKKHTNKN